MESTFEYISSGGNCHPSAADWDHVEGLLAFGAGVNVALWPMTITSSYGTKALLRAHSDTIHAVRFVLVDGAKSYLVSGGADKCLSLFKPGPNHTKPTPQFVLVHLSSNAHGASINCIASSSDGAGILATGGADGVVKIWNIRCEDGHETLQCRQTIAPLPNLIPMTLAFARLDISGSLLAVGGTRSSIQLYTANKQEAFQQQSTLYGHDAWIRSLEFIRETAEGDILLASASQDKYIRLWRIHSVRSQAKSDILEAPGLASTVSHALLEPSLSNKVHRIITEQSVYTVMFEALLVGHEDWIYSVRWCKTLDNLQLLSTSADNTVAIWEADPYEGVWFASHRLGEISAQKGSTTATGSMGGLWNGLWGPEGSSLVALAKTGGWRRWDFAPISQTWCQNLGIGGHTKSVRGLSWSRDGAYLLTTSADQTTRLHSQWQGPGAPSWHEFSRPQIHGYDLNCVAAINNISFVSGADEKLLRVFDEPDDIALLLEKLCAIQAPDHRNLLAADIPVLGLSNKATDATVHRVEEDQFEADSIGDHVLLQDYRQPPFEDYLSKKSLWPETEKLYGHGFEVSAVAVSHDGALIASSCKASSVDHAVIRLFDTQSWQQIVPSLKAHTLTVTGLAFNEDGNYLLSVGRDRQWIVWQRDGEAATRYSQQATDAKAHSRMILCASWIHGTEIPTFMTGGRDKCIKLWKLDGSGSCLLTTISTSAPVVTIDAVRNESANSSLLALGMETGEIRVMSFNLKTLQIENEIDLLQNLYPALSVTQLSWRPRNHIHHDSKQKFTLAVASEDHSIRLLSFDGRSNTDGEARASNHG